MGRRIGYRLGGRWIDRLGRQEPLGDEHLLEGPNADLQHRWVGLACSEPLQGQPRRGHQAQRAREEHGIHGLAQRFAHCRFIQSRGDHRGRQIALRAGQSDEAATRARLGPGLKVTITECDGAWCQVSASGQGSSVYTGYLHQEELWGVYPDEKFD